MNMKKDFFNFIKCSTTSYQTVKTIESKLIENNFSKLELSEKWNISSERASCFYLTVNDSTCIAFKIPQKECKMFKIVASHTDMPSFKLKPSPEMANNGYKKLNIETYGGPILNTWLDRPLSIAGRIISKGENTFSPKIDFIDFKRALLTIPNLAIHMNRDVNKGIELNKQVDMIPILGTYLDKANKKFKIVDAIANELNIDKEKIIDFDLYLYNYEEPCTLGIDNEIISAPRLDNLSMVYTSLEAFLATEPTNEINIFASFDNEEIGSKTRQGGDSQLLAQVLERIASSLNHDKESFYKMINNSFLISADVAHAVHPNQPEKHDPILRPQINKGLAIKQSANQNYITDSLSIAIFKQICEPEKIPYQEYANRSDSTGGSTLGPKLSSFLPTRIVELGIPILAMHSAREMMGTKDLKHSKEALVAFYNAE
ncbi:MAG: M18 family aminopeptidase [Spirochaetales bacterium]|nr:M18 family aminopeptidase [Spirochaetales bacterium]